MRLILAVVLVWAGLLGAQTKKTPKKAAETVIGCLDQREGRYILTDDRALRKIASLEPGGFPEEGFAKYVGQKVAVTGPVSGEGPDRVVKVRSVKKIAENCAPE